MPKDGLQDRVCHAKRVVSARRGRALWCEDVQKSSRYDGELDEELEHADCATVEFELYTRSAAIHSPSFLPLRMKEKVVTRPSCYCLMSPRLRSSDQNLD